MTSFSSYRGKQSTSLAADLLGPRKMLPPSVLPAGAEFDLVKKVRAAISGVGATATPATAERYTQIAARLAARGEGPENARSRQDFYLRRAAVLFVEAQRARQALRTRDCSSVGSPERARAVAELDRIALVFRRFPPDPERKRHLSPATVEAGITWRSIAAGRPPHQLKGKRRGLGWLVKKEGWQDLLLQHISPRHKSALAVALLTGCRPAELAQGVRVSVVGENLHAIIHGAKIGRNRGQPSRTLVISIESAAGKLLATLVADGEVVVATSSAKAFGAAVTEAGRRAWPRSRFRVSPYSLRHHVASQLRSANVDEETVAVCLGHRATRSQGAYGRACHGGAVRLAITDAQASLPVRRTGHAPPRATPVAATPSTDYPVGPRLR